MSQHYLHQQLNTKRRKDGDISSVVHTSSPLQRVLVAGICLVPAIRCLGRECMYWISACVSAVCLQVIA
jgi:hypothetical protein